MLTQLEGADVDFEFVEAVDGRNVEIDDQTLLAADHLQAGRFWPNMVACALSHRKVYRRVLEDGNDAAIVLEDDVTLCESFASVARGVRELLAGAEVALLHYHCADVCAVSTKGATPMAGGRWLSYFVDLRRVGSAGAYVITAEACERMLELLKPVRVAADNWGFYYQHGGFDRLRCVYPRPVSKASSFRSTIGYYAPGGWRSHVSSFM
jgi:glycosyl transferase family 25